MFKDLRETIEAYKARDPAARSSFEVWLLYPGIKATQSHKRAHCATPTATSCSPESYPSAAAKKRESRYTPALKSASASSSTTAWASS